MPSTSSLVALARASFARASSSLQNVAAPQTTGPGGPAPHVPPTVTRLVTAQPTAGQPSAPTNQPLLVSFRPRGLRTAPGHFTTPQAFPHQADSAAAAPPESDPESGPSKETSI